MRILAFFFARAGAANTAVQALASELDLNGGRVDVAPLVVEGDEGTIVAFSADSDEGPQAIDIAARHGGRLVADVPEEWTGLNSR